MANEFKIKNGLIVSGSVDIEQNLTVRGTLTTDGLTGDVDYSNIINAPTLVSGSAQISFNGITDKPTLISGSSQILNSSGIWSGSAQLPSGVISGSAQLPNGVISGSAQLPTDIISSSAQLETLGYATTGSNDFIGTQTITGSLYISQNLIVQGSSSLENITGSNVYIGTNKINLNTDTPAIRFGGVSVFDSGSNFGESGSLLWDSQANHWIYQHPSSSGAPYGSAILISGPKNTGSLGDEQGLTIGKISKAVGDDHIGDSIISEIGGGIGIGGVLSVTGSIFSSGNIGVGLTDLGPDGISLSTSSNYSWSEGSGNAYATLFRQRNSAATVIASGYKRSNTGTFASSYGISMARSAIAVGYNNGSISFFSDGASNVANGTDITPTERMTLISSGNLGIGTSNPTALLHLSGASPYIFLDDTSTTGTKNRFQIITGDVGVTQSGIFSFNNTSGTSLTDVLTINELGRIGIGTTSPNVKLEILDTATSSGEIARFQRNLDQINEYTYIKIGNASYPAYFGSMLGTYDIAYMSMSPNPTDGKAICIRTTDGNVGVGVTNPLAKLTVQSGGATGVLLEQDINNSGVSSRLVARYASGTGTIRYDSGGWRFNTNATLNETSGTERALISTDGYFRMLSGTGGIQFQGNTAAANALNYYEQGSWTPSLQNATVSYSDRSGTYVRIGDYVFIRWGFRISSISGQSGTVQISGLPFTSVNWGSYQEPNISVSTGNLVTADYAQRARVFIGGNGTSIFGRIANNGDTTWNTSELQAGSWIIGEIFYNVP